MIQRIRNEPVILTNTIAALISLAIALGAPITTEQTAAITTIIVALAALIARTTVTPTKDTTT